MNDVPCPRCGRPVVDVGVLMLAMDVVMKSIAPGDTKRQTAERVAARYVAILAEHDPR